VRPKLTEAEKDVIVDMYLRKQSINFIALATGSSKETVRAVLVSRGVKIRPRGKGTRGNWGWTGGAA